MLGPCYALPKVYPRVRYKNGKNAIFLDVIVKLRKGSKPVDNVFHDSQVMFLEK